MSRPAPGRLARQLLRARSGLAMLEFALVLPVILLVGLYGAELTNMAVVRMMVSQIALSTADNASRMEQTDNSGTAPTVTETDIESVLTGAVLEGSAISLADNGRVILSSLEVKDGTTSTQIIHWQRCTGSLALDSQYGLQGETVTSMGSGANAVTADANDAVMFVEVYYRYTGLFGSTFVAPFTLHREGAFLIRDDRDLDSLSGTKTTGC
ncbi:pilus assembly protein [Novosphingobium profundi]|uniref:TadE/TadG family type IV pilus assembly protein n=1 Tax=Novosphingobium profundi TaxID=1774954 RepID=UPI001BD948CD|nr:pilus assembly protein [Novosphingobium profundi]